MIVLGMTLSIPASPRRRLRAHRTRALRRPRRRRALRGHGLPDDAGADHGAVVGSRRGRSRSRSGRPSAGGSPRSGRSSPALCSSTSSWGSVFLVTLPLVASPCSWRSRFVPSHVNESTEPVDNLGGFLSAVLVGALVVAINFLPVPNEQTVALGLLVVAAVAGVLFFLRQRRAANPLYDLRIAARPTFWVAACAGIIVFGSLMGAAFISQQFLQNVLGYSTLEAGAAILPAVLFMVLVAPRSAKLVGSHGSRRTLLTGQSLIFLAFVPMLLLWRRGHPVLAGRAPATVPRGRGGPRRHAVLELADGLGARDTRRHGVGNRRSAARPRRSADDVDLRRAPHRRLRVGDGHGDRRVREERHRQRRRPRSSSPSRAPRTSPRRTRSTRARSRRRRSSRSSTATVGVHRGDGRDADRDGARLPLLPAEGRRGGAARRVSTPRTRHDGYLDGKGLSDGRSDRRVLRRARPARARAAPRSGERNASFRSPGRKADGQLAGATWRSP